ncbi:uncharacterized protein LOC123230057 [Mangifera indica]|uniref:uncharacterized protein LOC123230057 n=1 Tax=Mangifera indica TaxID=29780 RepID=UPI001CF9E621|nr:uncharacterized protein LOC123230057 [Mangifera indica]
MTFDKKLLSVGPTNIKSDHVLLGYNCNTCEVFEFSCDTEAIITFTPEQKNKTKSGVKRIKKCGVRLVFTQEFNEPMTRSTCTIIDEEEVQEEAYSVSKGFRSSNFFKGESSSRYSIIDEEHKEAYSKGFKSSNFFIGESSSSSGLHQLQHEEEEVEEFNPSANNFNPSPNESSRFTSDLNEIPQYLIGSTRDKTGTNRLNPADNDGVKLKGCGCVIL